MEKYGKYVLVGIWILCGLFNCMWHTKQVEHDNSDYDYLDWKGVLTNTLWGPIKLYCIIVARLL